jgi:hypothetical protein
VLAQGAQQFLADHERAVEHDAPAAAVAVSLLGAPGGDRGQDGLLRLGPEPLERADLLRRCGGLQGVHRVDGELLEQATGALGSQAGQAGDLQQAHGELGPELDRRRDVAVVGEGQDLLLDDRADARQLGGAALAGQRGDRDRRVAHRLGRVAIRDDPVDDRPIELIQVAQLVQSLGDLRIGGVRHIRSLDGRLRETSVLGEPLYFLK